MLGLAVKRSDALSPAPPGESEGEGGGWVKNNARDVLFSLALCKSALLSEQAVCPIVSFGHSLGDSRPVPEGSAFRRVLTASVNAGHSGLSSVFPSNERSARYSHLHEESDLFLQ